MPEQKRSFISFNAILLILLLVLLVVIFLGTSKISDLKQSSKTPSTVSNLPNKDESQINPKKEYSNPFSKDTQYINPFNEYVNPFDR